MPSCSNSPRRRSPLLPGEVSFYGLDLYSLQGSIAAVIAYPDWADPPAAKRARHYYGCFDHYYAESPQEYGFQSVFGLNRSCKEAVIHQLPLLSKQPNDYL
jgi:erythromycin esterase-like protein